MRKHFLNSTEVSHQEDMNILEWMTTNENTSPINGAMWIIDDESDDLQNTN